VDVGRARSSIQGLTRPVLGHGHDNHREARHLVPRVHGQRPFLEHVVQVDAMDLVPLAFAAGE
jgi:hypothetical protein